MRTFRTLAAVTTVAGALALAAPTAVAAPADASAQATDVRQSADPTDARPSKPVIATYRGKKIDLSQGWGGARVCTEVTGGAVYCHDSIAEADQALATIDPASAETSRKAPAAGASLTDADCSSGWVCIWEHSNYTGAALRWSQFGTKYLSDWGFRDRASSACAYNASGATLYDDRALQPDPSLYLGWGCYDLSAQGYPYGGSWNDRVDYLTVN
ncbi:peptidase inhibitor family I36 protein [Kitasatospora sp. NPDC058406]|uniref:peptidase inhibitor family I36 protein n=1 Tax=Streptomycetaceae TaxID=2062 RepID=UPI002E79E5A9|nr:peptidase inhibitor family I36 protein [Streptomyces sp. BE303]MED7954712.1 peptidase inhibitor family I36 protein [Streptomyces sp. BE303]